MNKLQWTFNSQNAYENIVFQVAAIFWFNDFRDLWKNCLLLCYSGS